MDDRAEAEARARKRFMVIGAMRFGGVMMILAGIAVINGALALPEWAAWVLIALGMAGTFVVPTVLARTWSTNRRR